MKGLVMATEQKAIIRRDSAVLTSSIMKVPLTVLYNEEQVPADSRISSFDPQEPDGAQLLLASEQASDMAKEQMVMHPFRMTNWIAKAVDLPNRTGTGVRRAVRVTLFDKDNRTVAFTSEGVVKSLDVLRIVHGDGPYPNGIDLYVSTVKTGSGYTMNALTPKPPAAQSQSSK